MTWIAIALIGVAVADLVRSTRRPRARLAAHLVAPVVMLAVALIAGTTAWADWVALLISALVSAAWIELSARTMRTGRGAVVALTCFGVLLVGLVLFSGAASAPGGPLARWLAWADLPGDSPTVSPGKVLLITALVFFNVATANVIVRLVLLAIGAMRPESVRTQSTAGAALDPKAAQPSDRLKGGRLLGPMERLVILGLGLAGEFGAASVVIAAKGLLRFPEIQASGRQGGQQVKGVGIDDVTEYFLVGSFVSWIVALASLAVGIHA